MIYIANWKMYLTYQASLDFYNTNQSNLERLVALHRATLVICPSILALAPLAARMKESSIKLGAQISSPHASGSYTGQVDAHSLVQAGCSYALVNHNEVRTLFCNPDSLIIGQIIQLANRNITPIICVGESADEYQEGRSLNALTATLNILSEAFSQVNVSYLLAYEPTWAIGTNCTPTAQELSLVKQHITSVIQVLDIPSPMGYLYGGSVTPSTISMLSKTNLFDGYLIGRASIDFQTLEKIVSWSKEAV